MSNKDIIMKSKIAPKRMLEGDYQFVFKEQVTTNFCGACPV
jgi:hypothetical protein